MQNKGIMNRKFRSGILFGLVLVLLLMGCDQRRNDRNLTGLPPMDKDDMINPLPTVQPAWQNIELVNVHSDESFTLSDFRGTTVIFETMATWCPFCKRQQVEVKRALDNLDPEQVVAVILDVDPSETAVSLEAFASEEGYTWPYAVTTQAMSTALVDAFGDQILSPTSTPIVIIYPDGSFEITPFGLKSWDTLVTYVESGTVDEHP